MNRLKPCVLLAIFFFSCSRVPQDVISKQQMAGVLEDIHLATAYASNNGNLDTIKQATATYLAVIYKKHGIDSIKFNRSLKYYSQNPALLNEIYLQIEKNLTHLQDSIAKAEELARIQYFAEQRRKEKQDSILKSRKAVIGRDTLIWKPIIPSYWTSFENDHVFLPDDSVKIKSTKNSR